MTEKWPDANPSLGLTNNYHNLFGSYRNTFPDDHFEIIHYDEYSRLKNNHIDDFLIKTLRTKRPDIVFCSLLGRSPLNPTDRSFEEMKNLGCKVAIVWPDIGIDWGIPEINHFNARGFTDLHVCWGREKNIKDIHENVLWLWAPQDET